MVCWLIAASTSHKAPSCQSAPPNTQSVHPYSTRSIGTSPAHRQEDARPRRRKVSGYSPPPWYQIGEVDTGDSIISRAVRIFDCERSLVQVHLGWAAGRPRTQALLACFAASRRSFQFVDGAPSLRTLRSFVILPGPSRVRPADHRHCCPEPYPREIP